MSSHATHPHSSREEHSHHGHAQRIKKGKLHVIAIFAILGAADALLFWFSTGHHNPWRILVGFMVGQCMSSLLLLGGIWRRSAWARYVLMVLNFGVIGVFGTVVLALGARQDLADQKVIALLWTAIGLFVCANTWLIRSKRVQLLAAH